MTFQGQRFNISYSVPHTEESLFIYLFILGEGGGGEGGPSENLRAGGPTWWGERGLFHL